MNTVLVIDDSPHMHRLYRTALQRPGYRLLIAASGSTLGLNFGSIVTNRADVMLAGEGSVFMPIDALADNSGAFTIVAGRDFTTAGGLLNSGSLTVGAASDLAVSGDLSLSDGSTLTIELANDASAEGYGECSPPPAWPCSTAILKPCLHRRSTSG